MRVTDGIDPISEKKNKDIIEEVKNSISYIEK